MTGRYAYHTIGFTVAHCQMFILKKTDLTGFFKIKPRHPDGLKKTYLGETNSSGNPAPQHNL